MADFSAVIRRAIDGLSDNTPEERGRIYGRARATIQRQLDSLPDGMNRAIFEAQLVKIENSILEIEQEYADVVPEVPVEAELPERNEEGNHTQTAAEDVVASVEMEAVSPEVAIEEPAEDVPSAVQEIEEPLIKLPTIEPPTRRGVESPPLAEEVTETPESVADAPIVEAPEVLSPFSKEQGTAEGVDASVPIDSEDFNSSEDAIDSELQIPKAPQIEPIKPYVSFDQQNAIIEQDQPVLRGPIDEPVDTPFNNVATTDNDSHLIDQAVSEIRSTLQEDASDPNLSFGFGEEALPEAPVPKQRKSPVVIVIAVLLLLFVALTFFFWRMGWQGIQNLFPQSEPEIAEVSEISVIDAPEQQLTPVDQNEENVAPADEIANVSGEAEKFTQRLNSDGSEIDAGPASDLIDGLPNEEGRSVASADASDDANQSEPIAAQADDGIPALQRMFFYETSLGLEQQARYEGSVVWSEKTESDSENSRPYIEGVIQVPERDLSIAMTIKLNGDETLPVSHLIDLDFSLPEEFDGGEIEQITEVKFKSSEEQTGDRLEAISAKIDTSFFVVGLQNDKLDTVESNLQLMSQRGWIDIPISYTNGRKALITLEKGASGTAIFDKVLASWKQNPVQ